MTARAYAWSFLLVGWMCLGLPQVSAADAKARVMDGTTVPILQFPELVRIRMGTTDIATGTLITPFHVLTAASVNFDTATNVAIVNEQNYNIVSVVRHPNFNAMGAAHSDGNPDIAILVLATRVPNVRPAPIYRKPPVAQTAVTLAGFGRTGTGTTGEATGQNPALGMVQTGQTTILTVFADYYNWVYDATEADTASEESGAPSFITESNIRYVAGVATIRDTAGAAHLYGTTTFHARVDTAAAFIDSVIGVGASDLVPVGPIIAPGSVRAVAGETLPVSFSVRNKSTTNAAGPFTVGIFLSTDNVYNTNDIPLGQVRFSTGLAANTTNPVSGSFALPNGLALGSYFVVAVVDLNLETLQLDYSNDTTNGLAVPSVQVILNSNPTVTSPATASVLTAFVDEAVVFSVAGSDVNLDALAYVWDFGDGSTATGTQVSHTFSTAGTYTITVTISDNFNGAVTSSVTVTVTPLGTIEFAPSKFKLDFKKLNADSISLAVRDNTAFVGASGKVIRIFLGQDELDTSTISGTKGRGVKGGKFSISGNRTLKYSTTKRDMTATLARYGAINSDLFVEVPVSIIIDVGALKYAAQVPFFYKAKKDKNGQGKF